MMDFTFTNNKISTFEYICKKRGKRLILNINPNITGQIIARRLKATAVAQHSGIVLGEDTNSPESYPYNLYICEFTEDGFQICSFRDFSKNETPFFFQDTNINPHEVLYRLQQSLPNILYKSYHCCWFNCQSFVHFIVYEKNPLIEIIIVSCLFIFVFLLYLK